MFRSRFPCSNLFLTDFVVHRHSRGRGKSRAALAPSEEPVRHMRDAANFRKAVQRSFSSALKFFSPVTRLSLTSLCWKKQRPLRCQGTCRVRVSSFRNVLDDTGPHLINDRHIGIVVKRFLVDCIVFSSRNGRSWAFRKFGTVTLGPAAGGTTLTEIEARSCWISRSD